jgi:hypothetical protein
MPSVVHRLADLCIASYAYSYFIEDHADVIRFPKLSRLTLCDHTNLESIVHDMISTCPEFSSMLLRNNKEPVA